MDPRKGTTGSWEVSFTVLDGHNQTATPGRLHTPEMVLVTIISYMLQDLTVLRFDILKLKGGKIFSRESDTSYIISGS